MAANDTLLSEELTSAGVMLATIYDADGNGKVGEAEAVDWAGVSGKPATFAPSAHVHVAADIADLTAAVAAIVAAVVDNAAGAEDNLDTLGEIITRILANSADIAARAKRYATTIGDGTSLSIVVTHNLGTRDVIVQFYNASGTYADDIADVERTTVNSITAKFKTAPAAGQYRVVVLA